MAGGVSFLLRSSDQLGREWKSWKSASSDCWTAKTPAAKFICCCAALWRIVLPADSREIMTFSSVRMCWLSLTAPLLDFLLSHELLQTQTYPSSLCSAADIGISSSFWSFHLLPRKLRSRQDMPRLPPAQIHLQM